MTQIKLLSSVNDSVRVVFVFLATLVAILTCSSAANGQIIRTFTEPVLTSDVAASESGIIVSVHASEGDVVKQGDVLAILDKRVLDQTLRVAEAKAQSTARVRALSATLRLATQRVRSLQELIDNGHANPLEVDQSQTELDKAQADVELAEEEHRVAQIEVDRIKAQIENRIVRCPFDGVVTQLHKEIGEYISGGEPVFATVVRLDQLRARFYLSQEQIALLRKGDQASITVGQHSAIAKVDYVSPVIDPDSRTGRVDVVIENSQSKHRCGDRCQWVIENNRLKVDVSARRDSESKY